MNAAMLKKYAELLDEAIQKNLDKSKDVQFLAAYPPLVQAIGDAKAETIDAPRNLNWLGRWELESNIRNIHDVSHRLAQFSLLLEGWELPSESNVGNQGRR